MARITLAALASLGLLACSGASPSSSGSTGSTGGGTTGGDAGATVTFWKDVAPIVQQHCVSCHQPGNIAPFSMQTYADTANEAAFIGITVQASQAPLYGYTQMPPWPPSDACNSYKHGRELSDDEINTLVMWATTGAQEGGPAQGPIQAPDAGPVLPHVDAQLTMPVAYTPSLSPDDYHCFVLDWPETTTKYVTGLSVTPGNAKIVHHVIAYVAAPGDVSKYVALENTDGGVPGYTCFGGGGADDSANWLGAWAPGVTGGEFAPDTGIEVQPGSKIILQMHYNVLNGPGESDLTTLDLELADSVQYPAAVLPFVDLRWLYGNMPIAAGDPDAGAQYAIDPTPYIDQFTNNVIPANKPFRIWAAGAHMHLRGKREHLAIERANDGGETCLLDVPNYSFAWQGGYQLQQPETLNPGDQLEIDCHWDNSSSNQPKDANGVRQVPQNLNWGEGTNDEMCLGIFYLTQ
ncbi:MAG: monooxygenase [Deltaproteobacteria bacterium]|nr:monooxygenase [Deltaproteobacteria bacterium]